MNNIVTIGQVPWSTIDMTAKLEEFASLYEKRPIKDNQGGMKSPHMFLTWFVMQALKPKAIIESGVWLGQGTWLLQNACPDAQLYCIDINLDRVRYKPDNAIYFNYDFATIDWDHLPKNDTVVFFDDHQNAYDRLKTAGWLGFKHLIFEDNYPASQGDCYSLKKAFMNVGFQPEPKPARFLKGRIKQKIAQTLHIPQYAPGGIQPNKIDAQSLRQNLEIYHELPPIFKTEQTRWNDPWNDTNYPTPKPLLSSIENDYQQIFFDEATHYTWMCYVKLK